MNRPGLTRTVGFTHGYSDFTPSGCAREAYGFSQPTQAADLRDGGLRYASLPLYCATWKVNESPAKTLLPGSGV